jgi:hypothetical protein
VQVWQLLAVLLRQQGPQALQPPAKLQQPQMLLQQLQSKR